LIEKYDGSSGATAVDLHRIHVWIQIHGIPELYRKRPLMEGLAASVREVIAVDMNNMGLDGGDFVRVGVLLDVRRSLVILQKSTGYIWELVNVYGLAQHEFSYDFLLELQRS
jgi:hypothetical protein